MIRRRIFQCQALRTCILSMADYPWLAAFLIQSVVGMLYVKEFWILSSPSFCIMWWITSHVQNIILCPARTHSSTNRTNVRLPFIQVHILATLFNFNKWRSTLFRAWLSVSTYRSILIWQHRIASFQLLAREYNRKLPHAQYLSIKGPSERSLFVEHSFKAVLFISSST